MALTDDALYELISRHVRGGRESEIASRIVTLHESSGVFLLTGGWIHGEPHHHDLGPGVAVLTEDSVSFIFQSGIIRLKTKMVKAELSRTQIKEGPSELEFMAVSEGGWTIDGSPSIAGYRCAIHVDGEGKYSDAGKTPEFAARAQTEIDSFLLVFDKLKERQAASQASDRVSNASDHLSNLGLDL